MDKILKKQQLTGTVVSDKMLKTVVVKVDMRKRHSKYMKSYTVSKRFKAHVETGEYHVGDRVVIEACKPMSATKRFMVIAKA